MKKIFSGRFIECFAYLVLGYLLCCVFSVHEPWFDEMQAWLIAKTAPWKELFWVLPSIEGHPPFFWLLLSVPARLGISGLTSLHVLGFVTSMASGYLLIFKSPFPRLVRCLLPFTFFLFYEYSIIVRPYCLMMLDMFLLAYLFPHKDEKPGLYVSLLAGLCMLHAFGVGLAGGIVLAWLLDMKGGQPLSIFIHSFWKDKRGWYLIGLLVGVLLMGWLCWPVPQATHMGRTGCPWWQKLLYLLFVLPADASITDIYRIVPNLQMVYFKPAALFRGVGVGLVIWLVSLAFLHKQYWKYLICPYLFVISIMSVYISRTHIGLIALLWIFVFWIAQSSGKIVYPTSILRRIGTAILLCALGMSCYWTLMSSFYDTVEIVFNGQDVVTFLRSKQLEDKKIFGAYITDLPNYNLFGEINFFTDHNIIANFNRGQEKCYRIHLYMPAEAVQSELEYYERQGLPDVLIGKVDLNAIFGKQDWYSQYIAVYYVGGMDIWKSREPTGGFSEVWVRKDVWRKHASI